MSHVPLTSDLQAGLTLPSAILVDGLAGVEASIAPLGSQDPQAAEPTLRLLGEAPLVWAHGLTISQPVNETEGSVLQPGGLTAVTAAGGGRLWSLPTGCRPLLLTGFPSLYGRCEGNLGIQG